MESNIITPKERLNLAKLLIHTIRSTSDEALLELGLVRDNKPDGMTYNIVDEQKWFLAKIKYGI
jgi:hypothetical protein